MAGGYLARSDRRKPTPAPNSPTPIPITGHTSKPVKGNVLADDEGSLAVDPVVVAVAVVVLATAVGLDPELVVAAGPEFAAGAEFAAGGGLVVGGGLEDVVE